MATAVLLGKILLVLVIAVAFFSSIIWLGVRADRNYYCPKCHDYTGSGSPKYCSECGIKGVLAKKCSKCGERLHPYNAYCKNCGTKVS